MKLAAITVRIAKPTAMPNCASIDAIVVRWAIISRRTSNACKINACGTKKMAKFARWIPLVHLSTRAPLANQRCPGTATISSGTGCLNAKTDIPALPM